MSEPTPIGADLNQFVVRLLAECYLEADTKYWERRAEQFAAVGTPACDEIAQACRNRATLTQMYSAEAEEIVEQVWDEDEPA